MHIERIAWGGWPGCYRLTHANRRVIVTADVGPRLLWFGAAHNDAPNQFYVDAAARGRTGDTGFVLYGGHRLWHAPEHAQRTYQPDNAPVAVTTDGDSVTFRAPTEAATGIQKALHIGPGPGDGLRLTHHLTNGSLWPLTLSAWALTMMTPGGVALLPLPPRGGHPGHLLPNTRLSLWPYTDLSDPRWVIGRELLLLRQDAARPAPQKIGANVGTGWLAYANDGALFLKTFAPPATDAPYPDLGVNAELFTNDLFLELETLGPLVTLAPGETTTHIETWHLIDDVPTPSDEAAALATVLPRIRSLLDQIAADEGQAHAG